MLEKFIPRNSDRAEQRFQCLHNFDQMYGEMFNWTDKSADRAASFGRRALLLYVELHKNTLHRCKTCWHYIPKMHLMVHVLEDQTATSGNPTESWCYLDESEIGAARKVAESNHPSTLHRVVIEKHRLGYETKKNIGARSPEPGALDRAWVPGHSRPRPAQARAPSRSGPGPGPEPMGPNRGAKWHMFFMYIFFTGLCKVRPWAEKSGTAVTLRSCFHWARGPGPGAGARGRGRGPAHALGF